jgi:hypothetical protein
VDTWLFHFLGQVVLQVSDEQKTYIVSKLVNLLQASDIGVIEITGENGMVIGFRSDSIVAWIKQVAPSPIKPAIMVPGVPGAPLPANGG